MRRRLLQHAACWHIARCFLAAWELLRPALQKRQHCKYLRQRDIRGSWDFCPALVCWDVHDLSTACELGRDCRGSAERRVADELAGHDQVALSGAERVKLAYWPVHQPTCRAPAPHLCGSCLTARFVWQEPVWQLEGCIVHLLTAHLAVLCRFKNVTEETSDSLPWRPMLVAALCRPS